MRRIYKSLVRAYKVVFGQRVLYLANENIHGSTCRPNLQTNSHLKHVGCYYNPPVVQVHSGLPEIWICDRNIHIFLPDSQLFVTPEVINYSFGSYVPGGRGSIPLFRNNDVQ